MRSLLAFAAAALMSVAGCATPAAQPIAQSTGAVSAADPRAAEAGAAMLRAGGSATDAAVATMLALTVVEPQSSGIGGGSFIVYSDRGGVPVTYDGRETAPRAATPDWFLQDGKPLPFREAQASGRSVGVPGNIRVAAMAHQRHGKLPWAQLFQPAIQLARDGFRITPRFHNALERHRAIAALTDQGRRLFFGADGNPLPVGTLVRNPALADFLEAVAARGPDSFYQGTNAAAIVTTVNSSARHPSKMVVPDVTSYAAKPRDVVCGTYRGHRICGMGPPSSGATTVFAILKQVERFDLRALGPQSPTSWHLIADSMRLAFADRERYLADPDFVRVPVAGLTDPAYLAGRSALLRADRALPSAPAGVPAGGAQRCSPVPAAEAGTSAFIVVDRWGNVVSQTSTIESIFGSGLMVNGYYLNNELTDFSMAPVADGCLVANRVEGGKRPRSSMSPTIVYGPDGQVRLAVGAAGGATIIAQVAKAIIGVIDWNLSAQEAIALPTVFAPEDTVYLERGTYLEGMAPALAAMGHKVQVREPSFKANAIERVNGRWIGGADPRSEGMTVYQ